MIIFFYTFANNLIHQTFKTMKNVVLTEVEVNELIDMYESEVERSRRRINNLQSTIGKLKDGSYHHSVSASDLDVDGLSKPGRRGAPKRIVDAEQVGIDDDQTLKTAISKPGKRGPKPKATAKVTKGRSGRYKAIKGGSVSGKVKWSDTILNIMRQADRPMLSSEITNEAVAMLNIDEENKSRARSAISTNITKLLKANVISKQPVPGQKAALFTVN